MSFKTKLNTKNSKNTLIFSSNDTNVQMKKLSTPKVQNQNMFEFLSTVFLEIE